MAGQHFISLFLICAIAFAAVWRRRRVTMRRQSDADEGSLWIGLAAGIFDATDSPPSARLEIALAALARRLRLRGALVVYRNGDGCRVIAASGLLEGLAPGELLSNGETYCGSVGPNSTLAIDYASLSEWRRHDACRARGWEAFIGLDCGSAGDGRIVVGFFDTAPREKLSTQAELQLLEQMGPWIGALAGIAAQTFERPEKPIALAGETQTYAP
jgi:hypothetical protein